MALKEGSKCIICLAIPSLQAGGMERVMSELATYFCKKKDIEVHLVIYGIRPEIFYKVPTNLFIHKPDFTFNNNKRLRNTFKTLLFFRKEIKRIHPNVILSFGEYWNSFVLLALLGMKFPVFVSDRCQPNKSLGKFHELLRSILYPVSAGVIVQTENARQIYERMLPKVKLVVIGNPIRVITNDQKVIKEKIVLSIGRLIESKHHDELIKLFVSIDLPGWKLIIIGDDAIRQQNMVKLKKLVKELNAEEKVALTGSVNDVDTFYRRSKIFAFASSSEGFPNVIGEAMSAGLPVVAFDCIAGPSEMIEDQKTGFLVPTFDYGAFKERLETLMINEELQQSLGTRGKRKITDFSPEKIGEKYYQTIFSGV